MIHFITASSFVQCTLFYSPSQRPFWNVSLVASTKQSIALELIKTNTQGPGAHLHHMPSAPVQCPHLLHGHWPLARIWEWVLAEKGGGGLKIIKCPTLTMIGHHVQGPSVNTALIVQSQGGGCTSRKIGWGCAVHFLKPLPYFKPKSVIFPTLFQTWPLNQYTRSDQWIQNCTVTARTQLA